MLVKNIQFTTLFRVGLIILLSIFALQDVDAQNIPKRPSPQKLVNDEVGILTPEQVRHLEEKLVAYDDSTSIQIAIVILPDIQGREPVDFAVKLGREWGVGNKETNNGVVLLMSMEEGNRKVFIAPGYGLEGALPDITCSQIVQAEMIPNFKEGSYFRGIERGVDAIIEAARGEYVAPEGYRNKGKGGGGIGVVIFVVILILVFLFAGRGGGGGGDAMSRRGHRHMDRTPPFLFFPPIGGGGGSGGFGGGGGGGFGGFGGGSFGGGGAGGSW